MNFRRPLSLVLVSAAVAFASGCSASITEDEEPAAESADEALTSGPGQSATDERVPELGNDVRIVRQSKISMGEAIRKVTAENGPVIEAKFELDHDNKLSLSVYPAKEGLSKDSERNVFQELAGDPKATPFSGGVETFADDEHVLRSSRDLTLVQLSRLSVGDAVARSWFMGKVFWAIPTIKNHRAGYGIYAVSPFAGRQVYRFVDGQGS